MSGAFEQEWRHRFERYATRHDADYRVSGWSETGLRHRTLVFQGLLDRGLLPQRARILDLGCGAGTYVRLLHKSGHRVVGLDYSLTSLGRAVGADPGTAGRYVNAEAYALPFPSRVFDGVVCVGVFQALLEPTRALDEIARVLVPGGILLVEVLNAWSPHALARGVLDRVAGRPPRLQYHAPPRFRRAVQSSGFRPLRAVSILLPPRAIPTLQRVLGAPWVRATVNASPARDLLSHAVWVIGERSP